MTWIELIVAELVEHKRRGHDFYAAWASALDAYPPLHRDRPPDVISLFSAQEDGEAFLDAFYRYANDAWHGRNPHLRSLLALTEMDVFPKADMPSGVNTIVRGTGAQAA